MNILKNVGKYQDSFGNRINNLKLLGDQWFFVLMKQGKRKLNILGYVYPKVFLRLLVIKIVRKVNKI